MPEEFVSIKIKASTKAKLDMIRELTGHSSMSKIQEILCDVYMRNMLHSNAENNPERFDNFFLRQADAIKVARLLVESKTESEVTKNE